MPAVLGCKRHVETLRNDSISYTSGGATHDRFKTFAIKIVMTSNNAVTVPKLRDMRAIALDS